MESMSGLWYHYKIYKEENRKWLAVQMQKH